MGRLASLDWVIVAGYFLLVFGVAIRAALLTLAAMILVDEGELALDDPVDAFLPELANRRVLKSIDSPLDETVPARRAITLRDLLTLKAGIGAVMVYPPKYPIQLAMQEAGVAPSGAQTETSTPMASSSDVISATSSRWRKPSAVAPSRLQRGARSAGRGSRRVPGGGAWGPAQARTSW